MASTPTVHDWELQTAHEVGPDAVAELLNRREAEAKAPKRAASAEQKRARLAVVVMERWGQATRLKECPPTRIFDPIASIKIEAGEIATEPTDFVALGLTVFYIEGGMGHSGVKEFAASEFVLRRVYVERQTMSAEDEPIHTVFMAALVKKLKTFPLPVRAMPDYEDATQGPVTESEKLKFAVLQACRERDERRAKRLMSQLRKVTQGQMVAA